MLGLLIVAAALTVSAQGFYMYPEAYEHGDGLGASVNDAALEELIQRRSYDDLDERLRSHAVHKIDLNNDGRAEVFVAPPPSDVVTTGGRLSIFAEQEGSYAYIGSTPSYGFRLGQSKNGYARLLVSDTLGNRTSWTNVVHVLAFDGERYVSEHSAHLSHGQMEEIGLDAYHKKDYATAEKWFTSLVRMKSGKRLHDENNLAVVYLRTGRYEAARDLLVSTMDAFDRIVTGEASETVHRGWSTKDLANTEYTLGKAYEGLKDIPSAWKHYYAAFKQHPNEDRRETLIRLKDMGVDTSGYTPIWETQESE